LGKQVVEGGDRYTQIGPMPGLLDSQNN
jgi:hypothetical protein